MEAPGFYNVSLDVLVARVVGWVIGGLIVSLVRKKNSRGKIHQGELALCRFGAKT